MAVVRIKACSFVFEAAAATSGNTFGRSESEALEDVGTGDAVLMAVE